MTTYIVPDTTTGIDLVASKDAYIVGRGVTVSVSDDDCFFGDPQFAGNSFQIRGTVEAFGLHSAFSINGRHTKITLSGKGIVTSEETAIDLSGTHSSVINGGMIDGTNFGITIDNTVGFVKNTGTITSDGTGILMSGRGGEIENYESITADKGIKQVAGAGEITSFYNEGSVTGTNYSFAGSIAKNMLVNRGELTGDVFLLGGKDLFDNVGGTVDGDVFGGRGRDIFRISGDSVSGDIVGGKGNDIYTVDDATIKPIEHLHGGRDKVISSVSYALGANMEGLKLSGTGSIDGTGNKGANRIAGNDAANVLSGGAGNDTIRGNGGADIIDGGKGNDHLRGGANLDQFIFAKHGGDDTIVDFQSGVDHVDLSGLGAIVDFDDMMAHHINISGKNLVIHAGTDTLTLLNTTKPELHSADFLF